MVTAQPPIRLLVKTGVAPFTCVRKILLFALKPWPLKVPKPAELLVEKPLKLTPLWFELFRIRLPIESFTVLPSLA